MGPRSCFRYNSSSLFFKAINPSFKRSLLPARRRFSTCSVSACFCRLRNGRSSLLLHRWLPANAPASNLADVVDGKVDKEILEARSRFVSKILLSRLAAPVLKNIQAILPEEELLCGNQVWNVLSKYYSMPAADDHVKVERNPERLLFFALSARPRKDETASTFTQRLRIEAAKMFRSPRLSGGDADRARKFIVGALVRTVIETALHAPKDLESLRTEYRKMLLDDTKLFELDALDELQRRIEQVEARRGSSAVGSDSPGKQGQQRNWPSKGRPSSYRCP